MKKCIKCGIEKELEEFCKDLNTKAGYRNDCKQCKKEYDKKYRKDHKEKINEYRKGYYHGNKKREIEYSKQYNHDHKEERNEYSKRYLKNRKKIDLEYRLKCNIRNSFSNFMKGVKTKSFSQYIDYTYEELIIYLGINYGNKDYHIDHIIPQSIYDINNEEDIRKCWDMRNLRMYPAVDNISKANKVDMELIKQYNIEDLMPTTKEIK